jgi:hypothetical protein
MKFNDQMITWVLKILTNAMKDRDRALSSVEALQEVFKIFLERILRSSRHPLEEEDTNPYAPKIALLNIDQ